MAQGNVFGDLLPGNNPSAPIASGGPVYGAPPKADKPPEPKTTWRTMSPDEVKAAGLPGDKSYQISSEGKVDALPTSDTKATVDQQKIATLLTRIAGGFSDIQSVTAKDKTAQEPGLIESWRGGLSPEGFTGPIIRNMAGSNRRTVYDSQVDVLDALLTLGTGAAYNKEQLAGQTTSYFPQYNDTEQEKQIKNQRMLRLIEAAKQNAGPAWAKVEPAIAPYMKGLSNTGPMGTAKQGEEARKQSLALWGQEVYDSNGAPLGPDGGEGFDKNGNPLGLFGGVTDTSVPEDVRKLSAMNGDQTGAAGLVTLAKQGMSGNLADEAAGIGGSIAALLTGKDPQAAYNANKAAEQLTVTEARKAHPYMGSAMELLGGMAGVGAGNALNPTARQIAASGGIYGGISGFGEGNGAGDSLARGAIGAGANALLGYGLAKAAPVVANALARRGAPPADLNTAVIAAGERQGIPVRMGDAVPSAGNRVAAAEASPYGGPIIKRAMNADNEAMAGKVRELGNGGTAQTEDYTLGQKVQGVGERYIDRTRTIKNANYTKAEQLAGGQRIDPQNAIAAVDRNIAELEAAGGNTNAAQIAYLKGLREDLAKPGGFSITEFQSLRSGASQKIKGDNALTVSDADRRLGDVTRAFTRDAQDQLPTAAGNMLEQADAYYAKRQDFIKSVLKPFMGSRGAPMTPEQAGKAFRGMVAGRENYNALQQFTKEATPQELADFRATIAESLVTGPKGDVGAAALASNIAKVPENIRALVFGKEGAAALRDLQILANAKGMTRGGLNNSKSGVVGAAGKIGLRSLLTGAFGFFSGGGVPGMMAAPIATEAVAALGQARTARLLLNPDFTKWLRAAPESANPAVIDRYFAKLGTIASVSANDNAAFVGVLRNIASGSPGAAAAQNQQDSGQKPPQ